MNPAQQNQTEDKRIVALRDLNLVNTPPEERFDRITRLTAKTLNTPISGISFIDDANEWIKSGVGNALGNIPIKESISKKVISSADYFMISDLSMDPEFSSLPMVTGETNLRFYSGVPLTTLDGYRVGVLFVEDRQSRLLSNQELDMLKSLGHWASYEVNKEEYKRVCDLKEVKNVQGQLAQKNRQLEEEKVRQEAMIQNIGDAVVGFNDKGEITFINKQVEIMTGWSQSELLGKSLIHAVKMVNDTGKEIAMNKRPIRTALFENKKVIDIKNSYVRKDGSKFPVAVTATPVVLHGQIVGGVTVFRDVTKEREVDRMKTEFISLASHQLRTPLSAMKWFAEMLIDGDVGKLNPDQFEVVNNIYQSNERMIELVNALLNISRIESGRIIIEPQPTNLEKLVSEVVTELHQRFEKKKQHLVMSVSKTLPEVNIDPKLVRHVYMNLLTNATKYSPEGGEIMIMISKSGNEVISQISDDGYGIPKRQQDQVFKKFFRAQNIARIETDGTGLGLYLTKAIVDSSGGKIWFESKEGEGTSFWFILPLSGSHQKEGEVSLNA